MAIDEREKLKEIDDKRQELGALNEELNCALLLRDLFPKAKWPVFTSIVNERGTYWFRIRDSNHVIKRIKIPDVPELLLQRPHIREASTDNKELRNLINRRR